MNGGEFEAQMFVASFISIENALINKLNKFLKSKYYYRLENDDRFVLIKIRDECFNKVYYNMNIDDMHINTFHSQLIKASWIHCNNKICKKKYLIPNKPKHEMDDMEKMLRKEDSNMLFLNNAKSKIRFKLCGGCNLVHYCSRKCQKYDWNKYNHKKLCSAFVHFMSE
eukprot:401630_1